MIEKQRHLPAMVCAMAILGFSAAAAEPPSSGTPALQDALVSQGRWAMDAGVSFTPNGLRVVVGSESGKSKDAKLAMSQRDLLGIEAETQKKVVLASRRLDLSPWRGRGVKVAIDVKAEGVPLPKVPWEGVRVSLGFHTKVENFGESYNGLHGTFGWRRVSFDVRVPTDLLEATLRLGIISDKGEVWFRDLEIVVDEPPLAPLANAGPAHKGHGAGRLRGLNSSAKALLAGNTFKDVVAQWNVNLLKGTLQLPPCSASMEETKAYYRKEFEKWDKLVELAAENRCRVILQLARIVGVDGWVDPVKKTDVIFLDQEQFHKVLAFWEAAAERYKGAKAIWAFELWNEAEIRVAPAPGLGYADCMEKIAKAVNRIDPERSMIVQAEEWWGQRAYGRLRPLQARNIIYGIHFYQPFPFSHQGIKQVQNGQPPPPPLTYPGLVEGRKWDKEMLRASLEPAREFQKAHNVHMFVSEFCAVRYAPGAGRWTKDCVELFEEYDWDWMWHAIKEWPGWSPDFGAGANMQDNTPAPNDRKEALMQYFKLNDRKEPLQ